MKASLKLIIIFMILLFNTIIVYGAELSIPNEFSAGEKAIAADVNANFDAVKTAVDDNNNRITTNAVNISDNGDNIGSLQTDVIANGDAIETNTVSITSKQAQVARYSELILGPVYSIGPDTGDPFVLNISSASYPEFSSATPEDIDIFVTGIRGPSPTNLNTPLLIYNEVIQDGDNFQIKLYVDGYDKNSWSVYMLKIRCSAVYIKQ